jgi:hypothetical protein
MSATEDFLPEDYRFTAALKLAEITADAELPTAVDVCGILEGDAP